MGEIQQFPSKSRPYGEKRRESRFTHNWTFFRTGQRVCNETNESACRNSVFVRRAKSYEIPGHRHIADEPIAENTKIVSDEMAGTPRPFAPQRRNPSIWAPFGARLHAIQIKIDNGCYCFHHCYRCCWAVIATFWFHFHDAHPYCVPIVVNLLCRCSFKRRV